MLEIGFDHLAALVEPGSRLFVPGSTAQPDVLLHALSGMESRRREISILTGFVSGLNAFEKLDFGGDASVALTGFFPSPAPLPVPLMLRPSSYFGIDDEVQQFAADIVAFPVTPFDDRGYCTPGIAADFAETALAAASVRIALVNRSLPRIVSAPPLSKSVFTHVVEADSPLLEVPEPKADPVSATIASHVARLIGDGATLQLGIGKIPSQVLAQLHNRRNLSIHSGIVPGGARHLAEAGALTADDPVTAASFGGSADFYRWLHGREDFRLAPVSYTHNPATLAAIDRLIAVNSAMEVDLAGQINAEWLMGRQISGPGGLPDFAGAARRCGQGLSVIALPSTDARGVHSRIVPQLAVPATISRHEVDVIVTEHGLADLRGLTLEQRQRALIAVAHPKFKTELLSAI